MFVTPQHQVKELRNEAGRNIVGCTMLCPELRGKNGGRYIHVEKNEEGRAGGGKGGAKRGRRGKELCTMHMYVPLL